MSGKLVARDAVSQRWEQCRCEALKASSSSRRTGVEAGALHTRGICQGKAAKSLMGYAGGSDDASREQKR